MLKQPVEISSSKIEQILIAMFLLCILLSLWWLLFYGLFCVVALPVACGYLYCVRSVFSKRREIALDRGIGPTSRVMRLCISLVTNGPKAKTYLIWCDAISDQAYRKLAREVRLSSVDSYSTQSQSKSKSKSKSKS